MLLVELLVEPKSPPKAVLLVEIWMHEMLHQKQKNGANNRFASSEMASSSIFNYFRVWNRAETKYAFCAMAQTMLLVIITTPTLFPLTYSFASLASLVTVLTLEFPSSLVHHLVLMHDKNVYSLVLINSCKL